MGSVAEYRDSIPSVEPTSVPIRTLLIHRSEMTLEALRETLSRDANYQVVADCVSTVEAVEAITRHQPDLVFVDAHVPQIELLDRKGDGNPLLIYLLEQDSSLIRRLKRSELNFVFQGARTTDLLQLDARIREQLAIETDKRRSKRLLTILAGKSNRRSQRFAFKDGGKIVVLAVNEVLWIEADRGECCIYTLTEKYPLKMSLKAAISRLNPKIFFQVNGSIAVNVNVIKELRFGRGAQRSVVLEDSRELQVSKKGASQLKKLIDGWLLRSVG